MVRQKVSKNQQRFKVRMLCIFIMAWFNVHTVYVLLWVSKIKTDNHTLKGSFLWKVSEKRRNSNWRVWWKYNDKQLPYWKESFKNDVNKSCNKNVQYFRCRLFILFSLNINKKLSLQCFLKQSLNLLHNSICVLFEDFPLTACRVSPYKLVVATEKSAPCICIVCIDALSFVV